jgi:chemotaxis regulatin CheY-phosphate phosphatase CheZ
MAEDLDQTIGKAATALADHNDEHDAVRLATSRITQTVIQCAEAARAGIEELMQEQRELKREIDRRCDALIDAANEYARICAETCKSLAIMRDASEGLLKSYQSNLPPALRLVPTDKGADR